MGELPTAAAATVASTVVTTRSVPEIQRPQRAFAAPEEARRRRQRKAKAAPRTAQERPAAEPDRLVTGLAGKCGPMSDRDLVEFPGVDLDLGAHQLSCMGQCTRSS